MPPEEKECCLKAVAAGGACGCAGGNGTYPASAAPIRYATGELALETTDLQSSGFGKPWGHTRSFSSVLNRNDNIGNGFNWRVKEWPFLSITSDQQNVIVMGQLFGSLWFNKVGDDYEPTFPLIKQTLTRNDDTDRYYLRDQDGSVTEFDTVTGMFRRYSDPDGNVIQVTGMNQFGYNFTQVERSFASGGNTTTEQFLYEYNNNFGDTLLAQLTLRRKVNNGSWNNVQRAIYDYYDINEPYGLLADLKTVQTQVWNGSIWEDTGTTYYRYWIAAAASSSSSSTSSSSSSPGNTISHLVKFVLNPSNYTRMVNDGLDPLTASDSALSLYADNYFEFDSSRRVIREMVQGGSRIFSFEYAESGFADGYNSWKTKTTETLPDDSQNIVYCNYAAQPMLRVLKAGSDEWLEFTKYDEDGRQILFAKPSAVIGYDEAYADLLHFDAGKYEYLRDNDGLIYASTYHNPSGFLAVSSILNGQLRTPIKLSEKEYCCAGLDCACSGSSSSSSSSSSGVASSSSSASASPAVCTGGVWLLKREIVYPSDIDQTKTIVTSYCYTFYSGTTQIQQKTTTLPVIPIEQNGSGMPATRKEYFDTYGNLIWKMDERGYITRMKYDIPTGAVTQQIQDVDTSIETDVPLGWVTPADGGLNLITDFEHDDQGRITQSLGPIHTIDLNGTATAIRRANWIVIQDATFQAWSAQGFATGTAPSYANTLVNPVSITKLDANGKILEQISAVRASTSGKLMPTDSFPQSSYVRWTTTQYTDCCFAASRRVYHTIPESGPGTSGVNYDETDYGYDVMKRQNRTVTPGGTITYHVFDVRANPIAVYIGTNDNGATDEDPTGGGAFGNNMVLVTEWEYDNGQEGADGNMTELTQHVDAVTARVTEHLYDWRDRQTAMDGEIDFYQQTFYDNLNRSIRIDRRDTSAEGHLIGRNDTLYDDQNRVFQTIHYGVNPTTGVIGNSLTDNTWYDPSGNTIKSQPSGSQLFTKATYDSLGRATISYSGYDLDETSYNEVTEVDDDVILEQVETAYDNASNAIKSIVRERYHNAPATQTGPLKDPSSNPKARVTYSAVWPDSIARRQASANYGTNGGTALSRPSTIPMRSDTVLVISTEYDSAGNALGSIDSDEIVTRYEYDDIGRQIAQILNYQPSVSSSSSSSSSSSTSSNGTDCEPSSDTNVTVLTSYNADGNVSSLTAVNSATGNQVTQYVYGTTLGDSGIASSVLKRKEIYPASVDEDDVIWFGYNRQSETVITTDQGGTVHEFDYDLLGRQTQDCVTALGEDVDDSVLRIETTYEVRGMKEHLTSYDNATPGMGSVVNDCQFVYNDFSQLVTEYQSHEGGVDTDTTPKVQYAYADGSANAIRPEQLIYPDGRELTYDYGVVDGLDDAVSRVASLIDDDGTTHLVGYLYLGLGTFVVTDYPEPETKYTLIGTAGGDDPDTGDIYWGFDRFGRIKDSYWYNYGESSDTDRIKYGYDRVGNRLWREDVVAAADNADFDELYQYDALHRLKHMDRGRLNSLHTTLTTTTFSQCWTLDNSGNWNGFREDDSGGGTWNLVQSRIANAANEIVDVTEAIGIPWAQPAYNRVGNMTRMPQPGSTDESYTAMYDAWNRLTQIVDSGNSELVSSYQYDAGKRRIVQNTYVAGSLDETRHFYSTNPNCSSTWQVIEERLGNTPDSSSPERQHVWGSRYEDDCVLRDRAATGVTLDERLYALQDANWNVNAILSSDASVENRYVYLPYGSPQPLTSTWEPTSDVYSWNILFSGYSHEAPTGLYYVRQRVLHPRFGSWVQRDPLRYADGQNLYQYGLSNPVRYSDPTGLSITTLPLPIPTPTLPLPIPPYVIVVVIAGIVIYYIWDEVVGSCEVVFDAYVQSGVGGHGTPGGPLPYIPPEDFSCAAKYNGVPMCDATLTYPLLYTSPREACKACNGDGYKPTGDRDYRGDHVDGLNDTYHQSCGRKGVQGHSVLCGSCCVETNKVGSLAPRCKCAPKGYGK